MAFDFPFSLCLEPKNQDANQTPGASDSELHILLRKQLHNNDTIYRRIGIMGAIAVVNRITSTQFLSTVEKRELTWLYT
jgi:hypothetical protein